MHKMYLALQEGITVQTSRCYISYLNARAVLETEAVAMFETNGTRCVLTVHAAALDIIGIEVDSINITRIRWP
jgi:hypothetical protein